MAAERYVSKFNTVELIFFLGFALVFDALNLVTFFITAPLLNPAAFILFKLAFSLMGVKNAASFIGFISPTVFVIATYMLERAKEQSPALAKADSLASEASSMKPGGK